MLWKIATTIVKNYVKNSPKSWLILSASYSELERQRLAARQQANWNQLGEWSFQTGDHISSSPFLDGTEIAFDAEAVGPTQHAEFGGMLLGGGSGQIYPLNVGCW